MLLAAATVFAAPSEVETQQPTFRSGVDIVQVDVVVVDKDGHPVRGLKQSDFTIRDRGKPQTISTFQEIGREPRVAAADVTAMLPTVKLDVASNQTAQSDRLVIMVIDDLHIWKERATSGPATTRSSRPSGPS
jgi:VWFA-related protein